MTASFRDRYKLTFLAWLATVMMAFAFLPALSEKRFIVSAAFLGALVVLVGVGLRALRTPGILVLAIQLVSLCELVLVFYGHQLKFGLIPTGATFDVLGLEVDDAMNIAQTYAAPAPPSPGLTLMVVFYIGLITVLVDFCAITLRKVPLAGLPLLALYSVPVASLPHGVPFLGFLPGAAGFVAMLMVDERDRLAHWGRLVARDISPEPDSTIDTSGLTATGRRISSLALACAVVVPIFVPVLSSSLLDGAGNGGGNGNGNVLSFTDPMVSLASSLKRKDPVDILRVTGDSRPLYLRLSVLDQPGPNAWTVNPIALGRDTVPANSVLPGPSGLDSSVPSSDHEMRIDPTEEFPNDTAWLPVPFGVRNVDITSDWSYVPRSQVVTANDRVAGATLTSYSLSYESVDPSPDQLAAAGNPPQEIVQRYGQIPPDLPETIRDQARAITVGADNKLEQAIQLQNYFQGPLFTYDLNAGYGYGYQAMVKFLQERRGFCQHFAATMAMMARTLNIPARVVVGFLQPERLDGDTWVFTSHNVHAWPELYFQGLGWVKFEPTPGVGAPSPSYTEGNALPTQAPTVATATEQTTIDKVPTTSKDKTTAAAAGGGTKGDGDSTIPSRWWLAAFVVVVLACLPAVTRLSIRRRRLTRPVEDGEAAEAAWLELRDRIIDLRLPWTGSMTPRARQRAVEPMLEGDIEGRDALRRLALTVERSRYARSLPPGSAPAADVRIVMGVISRTAEPMQRVRALLWPSSLIPDLRAAWRAWRERRTRPQPVDA